MVRQSDEIERRMAFSQRFGHYFRTPLSYEREEDVVGKIFREISHYFEKEPISFTYYWGVGTKSQPDQAETDFIGYLDEFLSEFCGYFNKEYQELVILTDTHARINSVPQNIVSKYFKLVESEYQSETRRFIKASKLWEIGRKILCREDRIAEGMTSKQWSATGIASILEEMASKHYLGNSSYASLAAKRYYRYNIIEKEVIEKHYPNRYFISWNSSDLDDLFPSQLSILHLHIDHREVDAEKPWFINKEAG